MNYSLVASSLALPPESNGHLYKESYLPQDEKEVEEIIKVFPEEVPSDIPSTKAAEVLIAQQLSKLSVQDREQVYHGIHGITNKKEYTGVWTSRNTGAIDDKDQFPEPVPKLEKEPPISPLNEYCKSHLLEMEEELERLPAKEAYEVALQEDPEYVQDLMFRLRFLLADQFDAKKAAVRFARHFETKLDLFGPSVLARDITQEDLNLEDMDVLYSGLLQVLRERDRSGRAVWVSFAHPRHAAMKTAAKMRAYFYLAMQYLKNDADTNIHGVIFVNYQVGHEHYEKPTSGDCSEMTKSFWSAPKLAMSIPVRFEALHICYDSLVWKAMIAIVTMSLDKYTRLRIRDHYGSHQECQYKLMTFGIPAHRIPLVATNPNMMPPASSEKRTMDGFIYTEDHIRDLTRIRKQEEEESRQRNLQNGFWKKLTYIQLPKQHDVLFGRGKGSTQHVGNIKFQLLLEDRLDEYNHSSKLDKTKMATALMEKVTVEFGGRFLKDSPDSGWIEVTNPLEIRNKIAAAFRSLRRKMASKNCKKVTKNLGVQIGGSDPNRSEGNSSRKIRDDTSGKLWSMMSIDSNVGCLDNSENKFKKPRFSVKRTLE